MACFLDEKMDTREIFLNLKIGKSELFAQNINSYRVVFLDFTDFKAKNYESAIEYLKDKMSVAYKYFYDDVKSQANRVSFDYRSLEYALDIIEKTVEVKALQKSLSHLLLQLRGYETYSNSCKLAVLIDNMVQLEIVAAENGYADEMEEFLRSFIVADVYKYCDLFFQISDCKEKHNDLYLPYNRYTTLRYFTVFPGDIENRHEEMIVAKQRQSEFNYRSVLKDDVNWNKCIAEGRRIVQDAKVEEERRHQEHIRHEKVRYATNLSPEIPLFSPNLGIRRKSLDKTSPQYANLNTLLKDIYTQFAPKFESNKIYQYLQKLNTKDRIIKNTRGAETLLANLSVGLSHWQERGLTNCWSNWVQVSYTRIGVDKHYSPGRPQNIKVYANLKRDDIQSIFIESLKYLLDKANDSFGAKVSTCSRADQMCYWLSKKDFRHLENYFMPYFIDMEKTMPFVAYKGMLGISREFPGIDDSHNATQANIIADYLKTVIDINDVDLENMYNRYIAKWNDDIYEEDDFFCFRRNTALSFIVLLDSLDAILSETGVMDSSLLMSDDSKIWHTLANSCCWADVNEKWKMIS